MLVAGTAMSFADYYVVGNFTEWTQHPVADKVAAMKLLDGTTDTYYADYKPEAGDIYFCIADGDGAGTGDDWTDFNANHRYSQGTANYVVTDGCYGVDGVHGDFSLKIVADGSTTYRIMFVESTKKITVTKVGLDYAVAGDFTPEGGGAEASFFGTMWDTSANKLTLQTDGTYTKTFTNVPLSVGKITYKITNGSSATKENQFFNITKAGTYDITFVFYVDNIDGPVCNAVEQFTGYYLITNPGAGSWAKGDAMAKSEGTYSVAIADKAGSFFAIAPNTALAADGSVADWTKVVRPVTGGDDWLVRYFTNYSGETQTVTSGGKVWAIDSDNASTLTVTFTPAANSFTITTNAKETVTIGSDGYATYSHAAAYKVSGCEAYIVTAATSAATLTKLDDEAGIPAATGIIVKGTAGTYDVTPSDGSADVTGNMLIGSGNYTYDITGTYPGGGSYIGYILAKQEGTVGFYKVKSSANTLAAHKAFLAVPEATAPEFIAFGGDATGIEAVEKAESMKNAEFYNLAGQRVAQPTKGLYIVNGKKVIVK